MDYQAIGIIIILAFLSNFIISILDRKLIDRKLLEKLKQIHKDMKKSGKSIKIEEKLKEINEIYSKLLPKQIILMFSSFTIFLTIIFTLNNLYSDKIIIPLPFKMPITNRYGIGPVGTFILFSVPFSILLRKLINKISKKIKWLGG